MTSLESPWPGLAAASPRRDMWPVMHALGLAATRIAPGRAPGVDVGRLREAGLSVQDALRAVGTASWQVQRPGVRFVHAGQADWPAALVDLPFGPVALSVEGDVSLLARPTVAVVGARACTTYGREWAAHIAGAVVAAGAVVVSGLAAGIDLAAHGAAGGATIAVLGQGIDAPMPAWQRRMRDSLLAKGGCVVSELPPDGRATPFTFPIRNRIIAGLACAVAVIEAGERSGARNTASHALRFGREVLALPGPLGASASFGCLDLIEEGATVIRGVHTIIEVAGLVPKGAGTVAGPREGEPLGERGILRYLVTATTPEDLLARTGLPYADVMAHLGLLELTGRVIRLPGRRYLARTT
ncbi:MAG: DNA-processing protein DprA [Pseudomonadota bacterium]|nr:DNA-processing protein DprA [Pseudomonadota bacterium]